MTTFSCNNVITLEHVDKAKIDEAVDAYANKRLLAYLMDVPQFQGYSKKYRRRFGNLGTKRDIFETTSCERILDNSVRMEFQTDLMPPLEGYDNAVSLHEFKLMAFYHSVVDHYCGEYVPNEKDFHMWYTHKTTIPQNWDTMFGISDYLATVKPEELELIEWVKLANE